MGLFVKCHLKLNIDIALHVARWRTECTSPTVQYKLHGAIYR